MFSFATLFLMALVPLVDMRIFHAELHDVAVSFVSTFSTLFYMLAFSALPTAHPIRKAGGEGFDLAMFVFEPLSVDFIKMGLIDLLLPFLFYGET